MGSVCVCALRSMFLVIEAISPPSHLIYPIKHLHTHSTPLSIQTYILYHIYLVLYTLYSRQLPLSPTTADVPLSLSHSQLSYTRRVTPSHSCKPPCGTLTPVSLSQLYPRHTCISCPRCFTLAICTTLHLVVILATVLFSRLYDTCSYTTLLAVLVSQL